MHQKLYKEIELVCPGCRKMTPDGLSVSHLELEEVIQQNDEYIIYGFFKCTNPECGIRYPIVEGVPCIIKHDEQYWWSEFATILDTLNAPEQIREYIQKMILKGLHSPQSPNQENQEKPLTNYDELCTIGSYLDNNYGEFEPGYKPQYEWVDFSSYWKRVIDFSRPGTDKEYDKTIELGCSVGRYTFEVARMSRVSIGMDIRFRSILEAAKFQRKGAVIYNRRLRGLKFEEVKSSFEPQKNALFIVADAMDPPFLKESFELVAGLNLLDNIRRPLILLGQMNALLWSGGVLILGTPYEWRLNVCEPNEWLETESIEPSVMVKEILMGRKIPEYELNYTIEAEEDINWPIKNHDRYFSIFSSNFIRAKKR